MQERWGFSEIHSWNTLTIPKLKYSRYHDEIQPIILWVPTPGEVKLGVTSHAISAETLQCTKPLAFLMDPPKDREENGKPSKKKQKKGTTFTDKNFGSIVDIAQLKKAKRITVAWRVRRPQQLLSRMVTNNLH